jgi:NTE family protein
MLNSTQLTTQTKNTIFDAIKNGNHKKVKDFIKDKGIPLTTLISIKHQNKIFNISPLFYCIKLGKTKCFDVILEHDNYNFQARLKNIGNLLHATIDFKQYKMLQHLLNKYNKKTKPLLRDQNINNLTPLMLASKLGYLNMISSLHRKGASLHEKGGNGKTVLHLVIDDKNLKTEQKKNIIEHLYKLGIDISITTDDNKRPFDLAKEQNITEIITKLRKLTEKQKSEIKKTNFDFYDSPPQSLVFKGGGTKGMVYLGALEALEELKMMREVKHVAGTSIGAIIACLVALNYKANEIKELFEKNPLESFLDKEIISEKVLHSYQSGEITKILNGVYENLTITKFLKLVINFTGVFETDKYREWIENIICKKTGIKDCTFKELQNLINRGKPFKELHVFGVKIGQEQEIGDFCAKKYKDLIVADAVIASMSFPFLFKPKNLRYKFKTKKNTLKAFTDYSESYIDGGLLYNFPIDAFDKKEYLPEREENNPNKNRNKRTLGLSLFSPLKNIELIDDNPGACKKTLKKISELSEIFFRNTKNFILGTLNSYYDSEKILGKNYNPLDYDLKNNENGKTRVINICNLGTNTFEILTKEKMESLIFSGKKAVNAFFQKNNLKEPFLEFIGREKYLKELEKLIPESNSSLITCVIHGPIKIGKSVLVNHFARINQNKFSLIYCIPSETLAEREKAYRDLAIRLKIEKINENTPIKDIIKEIFIKLKNNSFQKPWLLIFDKIKEKIKEYPLEQSPKGGLIILTSREKILNNQNFDIKYIKIEESIKDEKIKELKALTYKYKNPTKIPIDQRNLHQLNIYQKAILIKKIDAQQIGSLKIHKSEILNLIKENSPILDQQIQQKLDRIEKNRKNKENRKQTSWFF